MTIRIAVVALAFAGVAGIGADTLLEHHQRNRRHGAGCIGVVDGQVAGSEQ